MMCSRHLFVALAAALCLAGVARAVDVPKNVDFSFEDLPKTEEIMTGEHTDSVRGESRDPVPGYLSQNARRRP